MFDIAWSELLLIAVVALIFIGPKELPAVLAQLGRATAKLRRSADEFRRHFEESMRESGYEDLHKNIQDFRSLNPANQLRQTIDRAVTQDYAKPYVAAPQETPPLEPAPAAEAPVVPALETQPAGPEHKPVDEASKDHAAPAA
jgi:sec-independent protein translocase protein TatB